jgi:hypothetical protein
MRSSIFAIALIMAIGLLATVHLGTLSNDVAAKELVKKKKNAKSPFANKKEFNYQLCRELGSSAASCGRRLLHWETKHPKGKVTY